MSSLKYYFCTDPIPSSAVDTLGAMPVADMKYFTGGAVHGTDTSVETKYHNNDASLQVTNMPSQNRHLPSDHVDTAKTVPTVTEHGSARKGSSYLQLLDMERYCCLTEEESYLPHKWYTAYCLIICWVYTPVREEETDAVATVLIRRSCCASVASDS